MMFAAIAILMPFFASAASVGDALDSIGGWVGQIGQIIIGLTVVAFFWGLFQFVFNEEKREDGKYLMGWSLLAVFIMSSLWGIIAFMQTTTGTESGTAIDPSTIIPKYTK